MDNFVEESERLAFSDATTNSCSDADAIIDEIEGVERDAVFDHSSSSSSSSSDADESASEDEAAWGSNKANFYANDDDNDSLSDDSDDSDDISDLEEQEAQKLLQSKLSNMKDSDYYVEEKFAHLKAAPTREPSADTTATSVAKDLTGLSNAEKLELVHQRSPEFIALLRDFSESIGAVRVTMQPLLRRVRDLKGVDAAECKALNFLEIKNQLLLTYSSNIAFYVLLKLKGRSISGHPVIKSLLELRLLLEKLNKLDSRVFPTIRRIIERSEGSAQAASVQASLENISDSCSSDGDPDDDGTDDASRDVYRVSKIAPVFFDEAGNGNGGDKESLGRASKARILRDLRAEFSSAPQEISAREALLMDDDSQRSHEQRHRQKYEEENFMRLSMSKKDAQRYREKFVDDLKDLNDFADIAEHGEKSLSSHISKINAGQRKRFRGMAQVSGDADNAYIGNKGTTSTTTHRPRKKHQRPDSDSELSDISDDLQYAREMKAAERAKKSAKKSTRKRKVTFDESLATDPRSKRAITYQIKKNKGLTPKRSKEVRNPRVKQRRKYEKAQKKLASFKAVAKKHKKDYSGEKTGIKTNISRSVKF